MAWHCHGSDTFDSNNSQLLFGAEVTHIARLSLACLLALLAATTAHAAPYELTVYSDDISAPGETEFESVFSIARPASRTGLDGHVEQALGEINYGIAKGFEIGLELPASYSEHRLREDGLAIEIEYLAPHDKVDGWFVGIRGDLGRVRSAYDDDAAAATDLDLDPIIGYRGRGYRMVFNPSLETSLSVGNTTARFQPSAKLAIQIAAHDELGTEYFGDWGPVRELLPNSRRDEAVYLVWDKKTSSGRLNIGLGRGLHPSNGSADKWVAKIGFQFDAD